MARLRARLRARVRARVGLGLGLGSGLGLRLGLGLGAQRREGRDLLRGTQLFLDRAVDSAEGDL